MIGVGIRSPLARLTAEWVPATWARAAWMSGRLRSASCTITCSSTGGIYGGDIEFTERLESPGLFGNADLVAQVGERREVILPGGLDLLPRRPALDPRQRHVAA